MVKENNYTQHAILQHKCLHYRKNLQIKSPEVNPISRKHFTITLLERRVNPG